VDTLAHTCVKVIVRGHVRVRVRERVRVQVKRCTVCVSDRCNRLAGTAASVGAAPVSSGAVAWEVRSALWKIKNWAQSLGFGPGVKAFQVVYEALMDAALQSGVPHAEGLTARMWQVGLAKEGSQLSFSQGLMDSTHAHLAGGYVACLMRLCTCSLEGMRASSSEETRETEQHACTRAAMPTPGRALQIHVRLVEFSCASWCAARP
jgi:hypothetical protein